VAAALVALVALVVSGTDILGAPGLGAQVGPSSVVPATSLPDGPVGTVPTPIGPPGRIAYATPAGDVVVAESDGSRARVIGSGAVSNRAGLAPLAWSPVGDSVAYVRNDGALVLAPTDPGGVARVVATDAVVPSSAAENILSFDPTGVSIAYIRTGPLGAPQAALVRFDGPASVVALTDPRQRIPVEFAFSPLDPYLYLRSVDAETGREFSIAVAQPGGGTPFATPFTVDDPVFSPDGAYVYGVVNKGLDQLVRVATASGAVDLLHEQDRICRPAPSPDAKTLVYAGGPTCSEIWTIKADGSRPKRIVESMGGDTSFAVGNFSWSLDGRKVSHAACPTLGQTGTCAGAYLDITVSDGTVITRAPAGSVQREYRALVKAVKVKLDVTGPIAYSDRLLVSAKSGASLLDLQQGGGANLKAVNERDPNRAFTVKLVVAPGSLFTSGTIRVQDPSGFDQTFTVMGSVAVRSFRTVSMRGIYTTTGSMPFRSGRLNLTVYR